MISIMFNIIPKPEYAKFFIFERKKNCKGLIKNYFPEKCELRKETINHFMI